ncbi:FAD:protein FMN transferase [Galbibacter sp.]|jgi:thiamine biosynthesis lipoprotein|uniref:FAD:protein FMN transferase n=1 Tax=Galbibacter sp. TaxID=2918471 RepID=UPI003A92D422
MELLKFNPLTPLLGFLLLFGSCALDNTSEIKVEEGYVLGTTYQISYDAIKDSLLVKQQIQSIFDDINRSLSTYLPTSDLSAINKGDSSKVIDLYFKEVYITAKDIWRQTDGYFDPTIGGLIDAWGFGSDLPIRGIGSSEVDSLMEYIGFGKVYLSNDNRIIKENANTKLNFNALLKGYTVDLIARVLESNGVKNYVIALGGEVLVKGDKEFANKIKNWVVAIESPIQTKKQDVFIAKVQLKNRAMATSGNYRKFRVDPITKEHYVHIVDPHTGYPKKSNVLSVAVVADQCVIADAYATALMVMPFEKTKAFLKKNSGIEAYIIVADKDGDLSEYKTKGFQDLLQN